MTKKEKFLRDIRKVCRAYDLWIQGAEIRETERPYNRLYLHVEWNGLDIEDDIEYRQSKAYDVQTSEWLLKRERIEEVE